ncbi:MAG: hypothetical protein E2577_01730, partial [Starkeya sp.]|nr:hypothetical protein [Starkeya sp.]
YRVEVEDPQTGLVSSERFWAGYRAQDNAEGGAARSPCCARSASRPAAPTSSSRSTRKPAG